MASDANLSSQGSSHPNAFAHILALFTVTVWGLTFVSSKILLETFSPFEVLFSRFVIGFLGLSCLRPRILRLKKRSHELFFAGAGLTGVALYFLLENVALTMASASNISVTVSTAPMFIAIVATLIGKERALTPNFIIGFVLAMIGITLISFSDSTTPNVGWGDLMAIGAALTWGIYSNIVAFLNREGYETIAMTKRIFLWGLVFMALASPFFHPSFDLSGLSHFVNLGNLLFLGLIASGVCFATWGYCVAAIGASTSGAYIYLSPAVTVIASVLILGEPFTLRIFIGIILVLAGLLLSEGRFPKKAE